MDYFAKIPSKYIYIFEFLTIDNSNIIKYHIQFWSLIEKTTDLSNHIECPILEDGQVLSRDLCHLYIINKVIYFLHRINSFELIKSILYPLLTPPCSNIFNKFLLELSPQSHHALFQRVLMSSCTPFSYDYHILSKSVTEIPQTSLMKADSETYIIHPYIILFILEYLSLQRNVLYIKYSYVFNTLQTLFLDSYNIFIMLRFNITFILIKIYCSSPIRIKHLITKVLELLLSYSISSEILKFLFNSILKNSNQSAVECLSLIIEKNSYFNSIPLLYFDYKITDSPCYVKIPKIEDYKGEFSNGVSYSAWCEIIKMENGNILPILEIESNNSSEKFVIFVKSNKIYLNTRQNVYEICNVQYKRLFHFCFSAQKLKAHSAHYNFYLNGIKVSEIKSFFPNEIHGMIIGLKEDNNLYNYEWLMGIIYFWDKELNNDDILKLFLIGPLYDGLFYGDNNSGLVKISQISLSLTKDEEINSDANLLFTEGIQYYNLIQLNNNILFCFSPSYFNQIEKDGFIIFQLKNKISSSPHIALLEGSGIPFIKSSFSRSMSSLSLGGVGYCFSLLSVAINTYSLNLFLSLLKRNLEYDYNNIECYEIMNGDLCLFSVLYEKYMFITEDTLSIYFSLFGYDKIQFLPENVILRININSFFQPKLVIKLTENVQIEFFRISLLLLEKLSEIKDSKLGNIEHEDISILINSFVEMFYLEAFCIRTLQYIIQCLSICIIKAPTIDNLKLITNFTVSTLSIKIGANNVESNGLKSDRDCIVQIRNSLLSLIIQLIVEDNITLLTDKIITYEWIFFFISPHRSPSSVILAMRLFRIIMVIDPEQIVSQGVYYVLGYNLPVFSTWNKESENYGSLFIYELFMCIWLVPYSQRDYEHPEIFFPTLRSYIQEYDCSSKVPVLLAPLFDYISESYRYALLLQKGRKTDQVRCGYIKKILFETLELISKIELLNGGISYNFELYPFVFNRFLDILYITLESSLIIEGPSGGSNFKSELERVNLADIPTINFSEEMADVNQATDIVTHHIVAMVSDLMLNSLFKINPERNKLKIIKEFFSYLPNDHQSLQVYKRILNWQGVILVELLQKLLEYDREINKYVLNNFISTLMVKIQLYSISSTSSTESSQEYYITFPQGPFLILQFVLKSISQLDIILEDTTLFFDTAMRIIQLLLEYFDNCLVEHTTPPSLLFQLLESLLDMFILPYFEDCEIELFLFYLLSFLPELKDFLMFEIIVKIIVRISNEYLALNDIMYLGKDSDEYLPKILDKCLKEEKMKSFRAYYRKIVNKYNEILKILSLRREAFCDNSDQLRKDEWINLSRNWTLDKSKKISSKLKFNVVNFIHNQRRIELLNIITNETNKQSLESMQSDYFISFSSKQLNAMISSLSETLKHRKTKIYSLSSHETSDRIHKRISKIYEELEPDRHDDIIDLKQRSYTRSNSDCPISYNTSKMSFSSEAEMSAPKSSFNSNNGSSKFSLDFGFITAGENRMSPKSSTPSTPSTEHKILGELNTIETPKSLIFREIKLESSNSSVESFLLSENRKPERNKPRSNTLLVDSYTFSSYLSNTPSSPSIGQQELSLMPLQQQSRHKYLDKRLNLSNKDTMPFISPDSNTIKSDDDKLSDKVIYLTLKSKESIKKVVNCENVIYGESTAGILVFGEESLHFISGIVYYSEDKYEFTLSEIIKTTIPLKDIDCIYPRNYDNYPAIEIFSIIGRNQYFYFKTTELKTIKEYFIDTYSIDDILWIADKVLENNLIDNFNIWLKGGMHNYEFLLYINTISGNSFHDLNKYPIVPWVLCDYTSEIIDLSDQSVYRDFSKTIMELSGRSELNCRSDMVGFYLYRLHPFMKVQTEYLKSIPLQWENIFNSSDSFIYELIPEFYSLPDFLSLEESVILPKWAKNSNEFIRINRCALESPFVSKNLIKWVVNNFRNELSDEVITLLESTNEARNTAVTFYHYLFSNDSSIKPDLVKIHGPADCNKITRNCPKRNNQINRIKDLYLSNNKIISITINSCYLKDSLYIAWDYVDNYLRMYSISNSDNISEITNGFSIYETHDKEISYIQYTQLYQYLMMGLKQEKRIDIYYCSIEEGTIIELKFINSLFGHTETICQIVINEEYGVLISRSSKEVCYYDLHTGSLISIINLNNTIYLDCSKDSGFFVIFNEKSFIVYNVNAVELSPFNVNVIISTGKIIQDSNYYQNVIVGTDTGFINIYRIVYEDNRYNNILINTLKYHTSEITSIYCDK